MTSEVNVMHEFTPSIKNLNFKFKTSQSVKNDMCNMFDYYADIKKKAFYMIDYFTGKIGKDEETNLILENGEYATKEQIEKRKKSYMNYIENSNLNKLIISFPTGYLESSVDIKKLEQALAKDILPMFFKKIGYQDIKKMSYQFALHTNTDNLHFHISFVEKEPNYKRYSKDKIVKYKYDPELSQEELAFLKNEVQHFIKKEKIFTPLLEKTNKELEILKSYFDPKEKNYLLKDKDDLMIEEKIIRLGNLLDEKKMSKSNRIKFNSIKDKEIKKITTEIKKDIFENPNNIEFQVSLNDFNNSLNNINKYFIEISKNNHTNIVDTSLIDNKKKYLDNYVLNAIINAANNKQKSITSEDIVQSIIYINNKKNKGQNKFSILSNYLSNISSSNKFKNKYKIRQAVRNINNELEEAQREFEKLFNNEKDYTK